ncbi:gastrula zinc finger protein xFG20-1-like [Odontomachus brunneus]|uniref:gastrula zinc finger protein xFG20-1-like n=1 Tax=Odontomachus brunneus TaxID=486640 RepID=UPI0013F1E920|nr:gastrula zinc finger protein xFG20-1-like [Odontomachus brunneus]
MKSISMMMIKVNKITYEYDCGENMTARIDTFRDKKKEKAFKRGGKTVICRTIFQKPYPCLQCNRFYTNKSTLNRHLREECQKEPQHILLCPKSQTKRPRPRSMLACIFPKPYRCSQCDKTYANKGTLNRHLQKECQKEPQYICEHCQYASHQYCNLKRHIRTRHQYTL